MRLGLIYSSELMYEAGMLALYRRHYFSRYRAIASLIKPESTVLDLCCGPGILYRRYLREKSISYTGFDINSGFVKELNRCGARAEVRDLREDGPLPTADYVVMQASLYHFLPNPAPILVRMTEAAKRALIISEPVRNLADSRLGLVRALSERLTNPGVGSQPNRFTEKSLDEFFAGTDWRQTAAFLISGGREKVYVFGSQ